MSRTTTLPRSSQSKQHPVQIYNGHKFVDKRNDIPNKKDHLDLFEWHLKAKQQKLYSHLQEAPKAVLTHDWQIAREELKSIKAIERIEKLKKNNMWSLRQLKKQKTQLRTKTHWDCMLDEMKWMRTDFKEERKWKVATAYQLAREIVRWHLVEDKSEVCVKTREPSYLTEEQVAEANHELSTVVEDSVMEEEETIVNTDTVNKEQDVTTTEEGKTAPEVTIENDNRIDTIIEEPNNIKSEEAAASVVDQLTAVNGNMILDIKQGSIAEANKENNDMMDQDDGEDEEEEVRPPPISPQMIAEYHTLVQQLKPDQTMVSLFQEDHFDHVQNLLFPDLLLYTAPDPDSMGNDPYFDEADYTRITPFKLATTRMNLIGTKRKNLHEPEYPIPLAPPPTAVPDKQTLHISPLFAPKRLKDIPAVQPSTPQQPPTIKQQSIPWTEDDDVCLIQQILQYSFNWELIADALNQIRVPITEEKRSSFECHQRWQEQNLTTLSGQVNSGKVSFSLFSVLCEVQHVLI